MQSQSPSPKKFGYILKSDSCIHCIRTLEAARKLYSKHKHTLPALYASTSDELENTIPFLTKAEDRKKLADVSGVPALFLVKNGAIVKSALGEHSEEELKSFLSH